jgi:uncharacterized protein YoxC
MMDDKEDDDPNNPFPNLFEGPDEYARRLFLRMNEQLERHAMATESRVEFILTQQAQFTTDMQALREAQQRTDERWARTESSIRNLLAIAEIQAGEIKELGESVKELGESVRAVDERHRSTDERLDALISAVERLVSDRNNGQG